MIFIAYNGKRGEFRSFSKFESAKNWIIEQMTQDAEPACSAEYGIAVKTHIAILEEGLAGVPEWEKKIG